LITENQNILRLVTRKTYNVADNSLATRQENVYQVKWSVPSATTRRTWLCVSSTWSDTASVVVQQLALITSS